MAIEDSNELIAESNSRSKRTTIARSIIGGQSTNRTRINRGPRTGGRMENFTSHAFRSSRKTTVAATPRVCFTIPTRPAVRGDSRGLRDFSQFGEVTAFSRKRELAKDSCRTSSGLKRNDWSKKKRDAIALITAWAPAWRP